MESVFLNERSLKQALYYHKIYSNFFFEKRFFRICSLAEVEISTNKFLLVIEKRRKIFLVLSAEKWIAM